jgi:excisionase family DNA binding protein
MALSGAVSMPNPEDDGSMEKQDDGSMEKPVAPEVLTISEVAAILRCSKAHVANVMAGRVSGAPPLPYITLGRRRLIRRSTLEHWMQSAEVTYQ